MRPNFIPRDIFRSWLKASELNKHATFDGILATSYAARAERCGRPIKSLDRCYRLLDIVARAKADGHRIEPLPDGEYEQNLLRANAMELRHEISELEARRAILAAQVSQSERASALRGRAMSLAGVTLLTESEIVEQSDSIADCCGVYFLIKNGAVVYVGQSVNVHNRIMEHRAGKDFDRFAFVACAASALNMLESLYIHVLRPPLNGVMAGSPVAPIRLDKLIKMASS